MLDEIVGRTGALVRWDWRVTALVVFLLPFAFTYFITFLSSTIAVQGKADGRAPPLSPYAVPLFGNLPEFLYDACRTAGNVRSKFGTGVPVRLRLFDRKIYIISGFEHVQSMFKQSRDLTTAPGFLEAIASIFGVADSQKYIFERDNTGLGQQPRPGSNPIARHNRVIQVTHSTSLTGLSGPGLIDLADRFVGNLHEKLLAWDVGDEWTEVPDLYDLLRRTVFEASSSALCGPHLFRMNPGFAADFWKFDRYLLKFVNRTPRWIIPEGYAVREKLLKAIIRWHDYANEHIDVTQEVGIEYEEYFGSKLSRTRQNAFKNVDGMSKESIASQDLGLLWAANANVIPLLGWSLIDILMRPTLTTTVLSIIKSTHTASQTAILNVPALTSNPLLQSIYAEELRIRSATFIQRTVLTPNFRLGPFTIPRGRAMYASTWHEARDPEVWNQGTENKPHSVDNFWAERFLIYPNDPLSGPRKPSFKSSSAIDGTAKALETKDTNPQFTTESITASFFPYGGGFNLCPGRFYAKQEAIGGMAMILEMFEIELDALKNGTDPEILMPMLEDFPVGVMHPKGKYPARIRRRQRKL